MFLLAALAEKKQSPTICSECKLGKFIKLVCPSGHIWLSRLSSVCLPLFIPLCPDVESKQTKHWHLCWTKADKKKSSFYTLYNSIQKMYNINCLHLIFIHICLHIIFCVLIVLQALIRMKCAWTQKQLMHQMLLLLLAMGAVERRQCWN